ncbi:ferredoxin 2fe-2s-like protein [Leishmania tarentolae]|uniref:Ferredoxin 2fe-2s-like protein n=1 Tax=Leishmania tarentolae TaxID=5689 RepID=A0A640KQF5_LEITA|nr:ferredoxin 2fe-2s-like protein [Leishmania tarentolae]
MKAAPRHCLCLSAPAHHSDLGRSLYSSHSSTRTAHETKVPAPPPSTALFREALDIHTLSMYRLALPSVALWARRPAASAVFAASSGASLRWCSSSPPSVSSSATPGKVKVHIKSETEGTEKTVEAAVGLTLMEVIRDVAKMDMEAACDGTCACSTCHVIFTEESYQKLLDAPSEDEMDMLDLAPKVTSTSRLSCQVKITPELDGISVRIPNEMENQMGY